MEGGFSLFGLWVMQNLQTSLGIITFLIITVGTSRNVPR